MVFFMEKNLILDLKWILQFGTLYFGNGVKILYIVYTVSTDYMSKILGFW